MHICLAYDISSNRLRLRLSKHCKRVGLLRLQKSLFIGEIDPDDLKEIEDEYRPQLGRGDKLAVVQMSRADCMALFQTSGEARLQEAATPFVDWYC